MEKSAIMESVRNIISEKLGVGVSEVTENASFVDDLGADSLDTVELVMEFEEKFSIDIPDEDAEKRKRALENGESNTEIPLIPPSVSVLFGAATENGTWLGGGAHWGVWKQDHIRYVGALARLSINLTF